MGSMIKPSLLILVLILNAIRQWLKGRKMSEGSYQNAKIQTNVIPVILIVISILVAVVYGFIASIYQRWRLVFDAVVMTGLLQSTLIAFVSMGVYDTVRIKGGSMQTYIQNSVLKDDISGLLDPEEIQQVRFFLKLETRFVRTHRFNKWSIIYEEKKS